MDRLDRRTPRRVLGTFALAITLCFAGTTPRAQQTFTSGSDGSDGPLNLPAGSGIVIFDPFDQARWGKVLDPDGDGVYHFTTINIASGVTLRLRGDKVNKPVHWLASGAVMVSGLIDLNGGVGPIITTDPTVRRQLALPGAGGYYGGAGGQPSGLPSTAGEGPLGGSGSVPCSGSAGGQGAGSCGRGGTFGGNRYLVPLIGGSGGGGTTARQDFPTVFGPGGGAGGGAILIASSVSINVGGTITAAGGNGGPVFGDVRAGGGGSGGAIRLVAPTITGGGSFNVAAGAGDIVTGASGTVGRIRLEGNSIGLFNSTAGAASQGLPGHLSTLRPASSVRVSAVDGVPVAANPAGSFQVSDALIEKGEPVSVEIQGSGIPPGTVVTLRVFPEVPVDPTTVYLPPVQVPLTGTVQSSTGTAVMLFPFGFSRCFIQATWGQ